MLHRLSADNSLECWRHFGCLMVSCILLVYYHIEISSQTSWLLTVSKKVGDSFCTKVFTIRSGQTIRARVNVEVSKADITNVEHYPTTSSVTSDIFKVKVWSDETSCSIFVLTIVCNYVGNWPTFGWLIRDVPISTFINNL